MLAIGNVEEEQPTEESLLKKAKREEPSVESYAEEGGVEHGRPLASMETDLTEESRFVAFVRKAASWLDGLNEVAKSSSQSTPALFAERFPLTEGTRAKMLDIAPWDSDHGYTAMLRHPRGKCKGVLHIACFDYSERGLHGKGIYGGSDAVRGNSCSNFGVAQPREAWTDRHCCGSSESLRFFWPAATTGATSILHNWSRLSKLRNHVAASYPA